MVDWLNFRKNPQRSGIRKDMMGLRYSMLRLVGELSCGEEYAVDQVWRLLILVVLEIVAEVVEWHYYFFMGTGILNRNFALFLVLCKNIQKLAYSCNEYKYSLQKQFRFVDFYLWYYFVFTVLSKTTKSVIKSTFYAEDLMIIPKK